MVVVAICLTALVGLGVSSCSKDEPEPEIVQNPLDQEVYYLAGTITDGSDALDGVEVRTGDAKASTAADGTYRIAVNKKGIHYTVSFSKEGYIPVSAEAVIPSDAVKSSIVTLSQQLTPANKAVTVSPDDEVEIEEARREVTSLVIPAGAVKETTDISVTEYIDGAKTSPEHISLSTVNCSPDGLTFEKPVEIRVKNATTNAISFADVKHYVEKNGVWQEEGVASFDKNRNVYTAELTGFSNHSFGPGCATKDGGASFEETGSLDVDNIGRMDATEKAITARQKTGWQIDGDLSESVSSQFAGLNSSDVSGLVSTLNYAIASLKGTSSGVKETEVSLGTAKVSGDTKMNIVLKARKQVTTHTFYLYYKGERKPFRVNVVTYTGLYPYITYTYGEQHTDHSGSQIQ